MHVRVLVIETRRPCVLRLLDKLFYLADTEFDGYLSREKFNVLLGFLLPETSRKPTIVTRFPLLVLKKGFPCFDRKLINV